MQAQRKTPRGLLHHDRGVMMEELRGRRFAPTVGSSASGMLRRQYIQKHFTLKAHRLIRDHKVDLPAPVVLTIGFADHLSKTVKRQGAENVVFQMHGKGSLLEI